MKKVAGYAAITYKHAAGGYRTGSFGEEIDVHEDDVKRLDALGAFELLAGLNAPAASDVPETPAPSAAVARAKAAAPAVRKV